MTDISGSLNPIDSLTVDVLTDDVSDTYLSKTFFAVFEFSNIVRAGAKTISGEALLCGKSRMITIGVTVRWLTAYPFV